MTNLVRYDDRSDNTGDFEVIEWRYRQARQAYRAAVAQKKREIVKRNPIEKIGRSRHRQFCYSLVRKLIEGSDFETASSTAVTEAFPMLRSAAAIARKANSMLRTPAVSEAIAKLALKGGLPFPEVMKQHVDLIRRGDWQALEAYMRLAVAQHDEE